MSALLETVPTDLVIGGEWRPAANEGRFEVGDPATGEVLTAVADASEEDAIAAVDATTQAGPSGRLGRRATGASEGGHEGLLEFMESKYIATSW